MFVAAAPVCWTVDSAKADRIARVPIRIFHGVKELLVLVRNSRDMYEALKKVGGNGTQIRGSVKASFTGLNRYFSSPPQKSSPFDES